MTLRMFIRDRLAHKRPVFSFEFFPPKSEQGEATLWRNLEQLAPLEPDFVSVTYGAGGSTRTRTLDLVARIKRELGIEAMAHLTCVGSTRDDIAAILDRLGESGVQNILALRGDPPKGADKFEATEGGFRYASDLVAFIRERGDFCIGGACYPEVHPEARDPSVDLEHLVTKVDAGCDFLVSQMFFDNAPFFDFVSRARTAGIDVPIIPGVMPVTNYGQIKRIAQLCGAKLPGALESRLEREQDDPQSVFWTGVSYAAHQCRGLLSQGPEPAFDIPKAAVPGIHFYTLNRSPATRAIFEILSLSRSVV